MNIAELGTTAQIFSGILIAGVVEYRNVVTLISEGLTGKDPYSPYKVVFGLVGLASTSVGLVVCMTYLFYNRDGSNEAVDFILMLCSILGIAGVLIRPVTTALQLSRRFPRRVGVTLNFAIVGWFLLLMTVAVAAVIAR